VMIGGGSGTSAPGPPILPALSVPADDSYPGPFMKAPPERRGPPSDWHPGHWLPEARATQSVAIITLDALITP
jgi:hypothetical protein